MKNIIYLIVILCCFSCNNHFKKNELDESSLDLKDYWRQLEYLVQIKNEVAKNDWKVFAKNEFFQPVIYYTLDGTFAINPNEHILNITQQNEIKSHKGFSFVKLPKSYLDTINFNFYTSYSDNDSTALYYQENVLFFQSFKLTKKLIGVDDLQDWSIMVIHELFHGYQRQMPQFKDYYTQLKIPDGPDQFLGKYHKNLEWFKESIKTENDLLKAIWINNADVKETLHKYDSIRSIRIDRIKREFGVDIREVEDYEILMEGHARYFESLCKRYLSKHNPNTSMLKEGDYNLIHKIFDDYDVKKDKGLYDIYNDRYYYQLGYNISMILEKYLPNYKNSVYTKEFNFNKYLEALKSLN